MRSESDAPEPVQPEAPNEGPRSSADELSASLETLSRLATRHLNLEEMLTRVADLAVRAIPSAEGAGLTLLEEDRRDTIVCTHPFVREVDTIQYDLGQGPCISAAAEARTIISGSLGGDPRWTRFGAQVARLGVHSVLSLPLETPDGVVGAMNVYARRKHAFDDEAVSIGEMFAAPAAIAVQNAQVLAQTKRLVAQLQHALNHRAVIERAVGILMSRTGVSHDEALNRLRQLSQQEHGRLPDVAEKIVNEAVRRARARLSGGS
jgi:GAF domain-containing protein